MQNVNRAFDWSEEVGWKTEVPELWPLFCYKIGKIHVGVDLRAADIVPLNISNYSLNLTERQVTWVRAGARGLWEWLLEGVGNIVRYWAFLKTVLFSCKSWAWKNSVSIILIALYSAEARRCQIPFAWQKDHTVTSVWQSMITHNFSLNLGFKKTNILISQF